MRNPEEELKKLDQQGLLRTLTKVEAPPSADGGSEPSSRGHFASNDYLGFSQHPDIKKAAIEGIKKWGNGSTASRLIVGSLAPHIALEHYIAKAKNKPAARYFSSGYAASVGVLSGLFDKRDVILLDKLSHASLIDGARLSGATLRVFPHNHLEKLEQLLHLYSQKEVRSIVIVTESVFSMDGDLAPLAEIVELKKKYNALLLLDEAHALGVRSAYGLGHELGLADCIDLHMGTLGKAAGVAGGYVACSQAYADLLTNVARSFIYSTAPPPAQSFAALRAFELLAEPEGEQRRKKLWQNIHYLGQCLDLKSTPESSIVPWIIGENHTALNLAEQLKKSGFYVPAVRFPTVPKNTARLRITLSASHTKKQIDSFTKTCSALLHRATKNS